MAMRDVDVLTFFVLDAAIRVQFGHVDFHRGAGQFGLFQCRHGLVKHPGNIAQLVTVHEAVDVHSVGAFDPGKFGGSRTTEQNR